MKEICLSFEVRIRVERTDVNWLEVLVRELVCVFAVVEPCRTFSLRWREGSAFIQSAQDVMSFLGRKVHGKFEGDVVTDQFDRLLRGRLPGRRVKHRMRQNWLKMSDKASLVLRVETVINQPEEFRGRRRVRRRGRRRTEWVPRRKRVASLFRYRELSLQSNSRSLNALAQVDDPTPGLRSLDAITTRKPPTPNRSVKAFNPVARSECQLFAALMSGEHAMHGFTNRDLRAKLAGSSLPLSPAPNRQSAQVSRLLQ